MIEVILTLAFVWAVIGIILWVLTMIPNVPPITTKIIIVFGVICTVFYLANVLGIVGHDIPVPRVK